MNRQGFVLRASTLTVDAAVLHHFPALCLIQFIVTSGRARPHYHGRVARRWGIRRAPHFAGDRRGICLCRRHIGVGGTAPRSC